VSLDQQASMADAIADISSNRKPQITEISQTLNSNYLRKGDLDALETKLDLKLTEIQLKMQKEMTERLNKIKESIESLTDSNRDNIVDAHTFIHVPDPNHKIVHMEYVGTIGDLELIQDYAHDNNNKETQPSLPPLNAAYELRSLLSRTRCISIIHESKNAATAMLLSYLCIV